MAADFESEKGSAAEATAKLPDGKEIKVSGENRVLVGELLFQPYVNELECRSMPESVWTSIQGCDVDCRVDVGKSIILSGGNSMLTGLQDRL